MEYGQIASIKLYKCIWENIIKFLPEIEWYKLKFLNKTLSVNGYLKFKFLRFYQFFPLKPIYYLNFLIYMI